MECRDAAVPWGLSKSPTFLPARAAAAESNESWGKGRETWPLSKTFRSKMTGVGHPSLLPAERHEAGVPMFPSIPVTC